MKIAFLSHLALNLYLFRLPIMKELLKKGHKVYAIIPKGEYFDKFIDEGVEAIAYEIDRASLNVFKEIQTLHNIKKVVDNIKPDILHTFMHKPNLYGNLVGHSVTINTVTGLGSFFIHNDVKSRIVRFLIENFYKITAKNATKIVFQNSDDLNLFVEKKIVPKEKAVLIRSSGIDTKTFAPVPKDKKLLQKLQLDEKPIVLMAARVIRDKGVEEYIQAASILKEKANFLYIGDIDRGNKNAYIPDWKNVKYLGFQRDVKKFLSICDIFVLPSFREGVPRTLLEAASMQKPIVTTNTPGCREVVEDGKTGFLVPIKEYEGLVQKLEILIEDANLRENFGKNAREKVKKEFDITLVVDRYIDLYNQVIRGKSV